MRRGTGRSARRWGWVPRRPRPPSRQQGPQGCASTRGRQPLWQPQRPTLSAAPPLAAASGAGAWARARPPPTRGGTPHRRTAHPNNPRRRCRRRLNDRHPQCRRCRCRRRRLGPRCRRRRHCRRGVDGRHAPPAAHSLHRRGLCAGCVRRPGSPGPGSASAVRRQLAVSPSATGRVPRRPSACSVWIPSRPAPPHATPLHVTG